MWTAIKTVLGNILSSKVFWYISLGIAGFLVVRKLLNLNPRPDVVGYLPEATLPDKSIEFQNWAKNVGEPLAKNLGEYLKTWHFSNITLDKYIGQLSKLTTNQLIYVVNVYNQAYYTNGKGTLAKDLADVTYFTPAYIYRDELVLKINKLTTK